MSIKIQIRRGVKADIPSLDVGELGYCTDTQELFIGTSSGNQLITSTIGVATQNWVNEQLLLKQNALPVENRRKITFGTTDPTGGVDGDIYFQYV